MAVICKLPTDKGVLPIKIDFPEGTYLTTTTRSLPVLVSFTSDKPLAFNSKIDFYDKEKQKFSIRVSGASDASVFTTFSYLAGNLSKYEIKVLILHFLC